jgi:type II secretory pathway component PulC
MVRALLIRQSFLLLDAALVLLIVLAAAMVVYKIIEVPPRLDTAINLDAASAPLPARGVLARANYDDIATSGLFGPAGNFEPGAAPPPPPPPTETPLQETDLNLRLVGITFEDKLSSAIIQDNDARSIEAYEVGEAIRVGITVKEIREGVVVIHNGPKNEDQTLSMGDVKLAAAAPAPAPPPGVPTVPPSGNRITLNRNEFIQELYTNYADLVTKVRPEMVRDASGKVIGVSAQNIGNIPLAQRLGLRDGDVLQSVNNEPIDSEQKIMEMVQKYRNSASFRIGIMRNGQVQNITYRLE